MNSGAYGFLGPMISGARTVRSDVFMRLGRTLTMLSFTLYSIVILATLLIGAVYATRRTLMPYHFEALETPWEEIDPKQQYMLKALLNGGGYFGLSSGLAMLILLLIPFRAGEIWAGYAIAAIGLVGALPLCLIVRGVKKNTKGNPPLFVMVIINALLLMGLLAFALGY